MLYLGANNLLQGRGGLLKTEMGPSDASGVVGAHFRKVSTTSPPPAIKKYEIVPVRARAVLHLEGSTTGLSVSSDPGC